MKLSPKAHRELESFFREYFGSKNLKLPQVEIYINRGARLVTNLLCVNGITFGRYIFIKPDLISNKRKNQSYISKGLLAHEATHVLQYQRYGVLKFFYTYLKGYFSALKKKKKWNFISRVEAYLEIPHEREARECAAQFIEWTGEMENEKWKTEN